MTANLLVLAGLAGLLFPAGLALWADGSARPDGSGRPGPSVLAAVAVGLVGYLAVGFALSFGGAAGLYPALGDLAALNASWTPLAASQGPGWALAGATGYFVNVGQDPGAYALFFFQAVVLAAALSVLAVTFAGQMRSEAFAYLVVVFAWLLYPLALSWTWGGGWLARLGVTRELGHGFVDAGGGAILLVVGAAACAGAVARLWQGKPSSVAEPRQAEASAAAAPPGPRLAAPPPGAEGEISPDLSGTAAAGLVAMVVGWLALLAGCSLMMGTSLPLTVANGLAGASTGAAAALGYMAFTTARLHGGMAGRGLLAGLFAAGVAAPFISTPAAVLIGAVAGLLVCLSTYLAGQWRMAGAADGVAVYGFSGVQGLIALGLFAHGRGGQGWNGAGAETYLGVAGQGVTGLWPAAGLVADPPQLAAQLTGVMVIFLWVFLPILLVLKVAGMRSAPADRPGE